MGLGDYNYQLRGRTEKERQGVWPRGGGGFELDDSEAREQLQGGSGDCICFILLPLTRWNGTVRKKQRGR
jgi:hypothetical protein